MCASLSLEIYSNGLGSLETRSGNSVEGVSIGLFHGYPIVKKMKRIQGTRETMQKKIEQRVSGKFYGGGKKSSTFHE